MRKLSFALIFALVAFVTTSTFAVVPDWDDVKDLKANPALTTPVTETLIPAITVTDTVLAPYNMAYAGHTFSKYGNMDQGFNMTIWSSMAPWMFATANNLDRLGHFRFPGRYEYDIPTEFRLAANVDVDVEFGDLTGGSWDAPWYLYPGKTYPEAANPLVPQDSIDMQYKIQITAPSSVDVMPGVGWQESPAGDTFNKILFKNNTALHASPDISNPTVGFNLYIAENISPAITTGDYVTVLRVSYKPHSPMWWIDPLTGGFDMLWP